MDIPFLHSGLELMGQDSLEECPVVSMKIPNGVCGMFTLISVVCLYFYLDLELILYDYNIARIANAVQCHN